MTIAIGTGSGPRLGNAQGMAKPLATNPAAEFLIILAIVAVVYALTLILVFPGRLDPLWPLHSDHYIAPELAHTPYSLFAFFSEPRPIGYLFLKVTGLFGTRFAIVGTLIVIFADATLTAMAFRRIVGLPIDPVYYAASAVYAFLLFAHPLQYVWSTYDVFSQVSYLFLVSALLLSLRTQFFPAIFLACLLGFLAKETYALSMLVLASIWAVTSPPAARGAPIRWGLALVAALACAAAYNLAIKSHYFGFPSEVQATYALNVSPLSILSEWWSYATEMGAALWACLLTIAMTVAIAAKRLSPPARGRGLGFALAGALAWAPNSLFPNHHFAGYDWNGAYLMFTPALMLPPLWEGRKRYWLAALLAGVLIAPFAGHGAYSQARWSLEQQARQRNLMKAVRRRIEALSPGVQSVLVTGLDFPFNPFDHPRSLYEYAARLPRFRVINYSGAPKPKPLGESPVTWITPGGALAGPHDEVWTFGEDGGWVDVRAANVDREALATLGVDDETLKLYPSVAAAFQTAKLSTSHDGRAEAAAYISCGASMLRYERPDLALRCDLAGETREPTNPYPHFFAGAAHEAEHDFRAAEAEFAQAVALDDRAHPNPNFQPALARVRAAASADIQKSN